MFRELMTSYRKCSMQFNIIIPGVPYKKRCQNFRGCHSKTNNCLQKIS